MATSDSFPENPDWAVLQVEAAEIQQQQYAKEAELSRKYSSYIDSEHFYLVMRTLKFPGLSMQ
ncbi:MAG: hypothetical protein MJE68_32340 [Proteobacteria bacterium]|nr:hypothetical protein [Pseudomonadota bacterium]